MNSNNKINIVALKDLREQLGKYIAAVDKGAILTVVRRSKPIFNITPVDASESQWEEVVDFTKIQKGGIKVEDILSRL